MITQTLMVTPSYRNLVTYLNQYRSLEHLVVSGQLQMKHVRTTQGDFLPIHIHVEDGVFHIRFKGETVLSGLCSEDFTIPHRFTEFYYELPHPSPIH